MQGQNCCRLHGGAIQQNIDYAARRMKEIEATKVLAERQTWNFDAEPVTDPVTELATLAGRIRDAVDTLGARVNLADECVCCGVQDADPVLVLAHRTLIKESRAILTDMARLNIEDRRVKIEEGKAKVMILAMIAGIEAVLPDLTESQRILARDAAILKVAELEAAPPPQGTVTW